MDDKLIYIPIDGKQNLLKRLTLYMNQPIKLNKIPQRINYKTLGIVVINSPSKAVVAM